MRFDLCGRGVLSLVGVDERVAEYVRDQMDPYVPDASCGDAPAVVLEANESEASRRFVDFQNPATDGVVTASDGRRLSIVYRGRACTIPDALRDDPARFIHQPGFPIRRIFGSAVRPALQLAALSRKAVAVHSASVEVDGGGVMVAGWSETGKTETGLAFAEEGAGFLSDKWTILGSDGTLSAFPIRVGVRRWALRYLPRLRSSLPPVARAQLAVAGLTSVLSRPVRSKRVGDPTAEAIERAVALVDRASLTLTEVRSAYGRGGERESAAPLRAVAMLTTVPGFDIDVRPADPAWAARRLAHSAAFERRRYFALRERARFALPDESADARELSIQREQRLLEALLEPVRLLDVRAPFPTDPRRVAGAIAAEL
jgi:hypothetical protein